MLPTRITKPNMVNGKEGTSDDEGQQCTCKIGSAIEEYSLGEINDSLQKRWTGRGEEKQSLRQLTDYFNRGILAAAMADHGMNPLDGEVENIYRLLTDEGVSSGVRTRAQKRLERQNLDVENLTGAFISHQTVYRHLKQCLDTTPETSTDSDAVRIEKSKQKIESLQNRAGKVTEDTIEQLRNTERIALDTFDVFTEIGVVCAECGSQYGVGELLEERGCQCQKEPA